MSPGAALSSLERYAVGGSCEAQAARGCCLHATAQLALEALRLDVADHVAFLRWDVRNDPDFLEHWALGCEDGLVIDMTAAQVDGDPRALRRMEDYPPNYVRPRRYPVTSLIATICEQEPAPGCPYTPRQLWALHRRLFLHDAAMAVRARSIRELVDASRALVKAAIGLSLSAALDRALRRLAHLHARQRLARDGG